MKPYDILKYPDNRLFQVAKFVESVDFQNGTVKEIVERMFLTVRINRGIGLAATQVDVHKRIIVIEFNSYHLALVNPVIEFKSSNRTGLIEGCLSLPDVSGRVMRSEYIKISYQDITGNQRKIETDGLLSKCIQHEIDHLNGVLYINRLTEIKKYFLLKKYNKK